MATSTVTDLHRPAQLGREELIRAFRLMYLSRRVDDREIVLKNQSKIYFQVSAAGHEAIQVAAGMAARPGHDWFYPYYRDRALALALGITPKEMFLQAVGSAEDRQSGGRQMPSHWSSPRLHIVAGASPTGTHFVQAVGCAEATRLLDPQSDSITMVSSGEGATSEGEFWESLNVACLDRHAIVYLIEDNGYAISVPVERQTAGGNIATLVRSFPHLAVFECDGTNFPESYATMQDAIAHCRREQTPVLVRANTIRPYSHSHSDTEKLYRPKAERDAETGRDPLTRFPEWLLQEGILDGPSLEALKQEVDAQVIEASEYALAAPPPPTGSALKFLYSDRMDPASSEFETEAQLEGHPRTMVDSINRTLHEEMRHNPNMVVFGEDVADCSREEHMHEVKGKGGVFKATLGLQRLYGQQRVFNTPIAEACIVGRAIGLATRGLKPVAEIQFFDYIWPAMMQIRDELATLRWRSYNGFSAPVVIRVAIGGYLTGGAIYHSQCGESLFTHIPGLRVVFPSNSLDACGLLRTAIRCQDPVLFLEHKQLYREVYNRSPHPGPNYMVPFGTAKTVREGSDLTIVTYGALVQKSLVAAAKIERDNPGVSIEVIDLRTLAPYDWAAIKASVEKTSRVMVAHEDVMSFGFGAEISARIANELFTSLDAPVGRVAALDTWVAYHPALEHEILPQVETITAEVQRLLDF